MITRLLSILLLLACAANVRASYSMATLDCNMLVWDGKVAVLMLNSYPTILDLETGAPLWRGEQMHQVTPQQLVMIDGRPAIVMETWRNYVYHIRCVDFQTGELIWELADSKYVVDAINADWLLVREISENAQSMAIHSTQDGSRRADLGDLDMSWRPEITPQMYGELQEYGGQFLYGDHLAVVAPGGMFRLYDLDLAVVDSGDSWAAYRLAQLRAAFPDEPTEDWQVGYSEPSGDKHRTIVTSHWLQNDPAAGVAVHIQQIDSGLYDGDERLLLAPAAGEPQAIRVATASTDAPPAIGLNDTNLVVADGRLVMAGFAGVLTCVNLETPSQEWVYMESAMPFHFSVGEPVRTPREIWRTGAGYDDLLTQLRYRRAMQAITEASYMNRGLVVDGQDTLLGETPTLILSDRYQAELPMIGRRLRITGALEALALLLAVYVVVAFALGRWRLWEWLPATALVGAAWLYLTRCHPGSGLLIGGSVVALFIVGGVGTARRKRRGQPSRLAGIIWAALLLTIVGLTVHSILRRAMYY